jgi:phytoene dehydrogenase-like protein
MVAPSSADIEMPPTLAARAWPLAADCDVDALTRRVTAMVERLAPGFAETVTHSDVVEPADGEPFSPRRLLAPAAERIETPVAGLFLCGIDAEPAHATSGRAARLAAARALAQFRKAAAP